MDLYPFNLVLAVAVAWVTIFLGALPTRLIRADVFTRQVFRAGLAWMVVGICSPLKIIHYPFLLGLLCLVAWWKLRHDAALGGKTWLSVASGLGISVGVVLILAVTPRAYPAGLSSVQQVVLLASLYLGGAVIGLAGVLHVFTRPAATRAGIPVAMVHGYAAWLWRLILIQTVVLAACCCFEKRGPVPLDAFSFAGELILALCLVLLLFLGWAASRQSRSPRPSASGPALTGICLIGFVAEILARLLVF